MLKVHTVLRTSPFTHIVLYAVWEFCHILLGGGGSVQMALSRIDLGTGVGVRFNDRGCLGVGGGGVGGG